MIKLKNIDRLKNYFSEGTFEKILNYDGNLFDLNQKRYAVVMFADISGYTAISEKLSAEEVTEIINKTFKVLVGIVKKYSGIIDKFIGDSILCIFGITNSDNPELASTLCALEMQDSLEVLNVELNNKYGFDFKMSVGIHSGTLIIGNIGCEERIEYTVIGDTVNTASRIQGVAKGGEINISEEIYKKISDFVICDALPPVKLKNKTNPIALYSVAGKKEIKAAVKKVLPLVGRDKELKDIISVICSNDDYDNKTIVVQGESGIGKSRLIEELIKIIESKNIFVFQTSGFFYMKRFLLYAFREIFYNIITYLYTFDESKGDEDLEAQRTYIEKYLTQEGSSPDGSISRETVYNAFRILFRKISKNRRFVFIAEDVQFFDDASLELLDFLIRTLKEFNIYFVVTKRDDFFWDLNQKYLSVKLSKLSKKQHEEIVKTILNGEVGKEALRYIVNYSSGNPNYIIELTENLKSGDYLIYKDNAYELINKDIIAKIPVSISALILTRVDKLTIKEKNILITASFFGRKINVRILKQIINEEDFEIRLQNLVSAGYIHEIDSEGKKYFYFSHQSVCDALYESVLDKKKTEIHIKITEILIANYKGSEIKISERLAYHYENGLDFNKAIYYNFMSGIKYRNIFDFTTANKFFFKALEMAKTLQISSDKILYFSDEELEINDFPPAITYYVEYKIKIKLSIDAIAFLITRSLIINENRYKEAQNICIKYSKISGNRLIFLEIVSTLYYYNIYIENKNALKIIDFVIEKSQSLDDKFYLINYLIDKFLTLSRGINTDADTKKMILSQFYDAKKLIFDNNSGISPEKKRFLKVYWLGRKIEYNLVKGVNFKRNYALFKKGLKLLKTDVEKISYFSWLGTSFIDRFFNKATIHMCMKAARYSLKYNQFKNASLIYSTMSYHFLKNNDYDGALKASVSAKKICEEIDFRSELGMIHKNLGDIFYSKKEYIKAVKEYEKSIEYKNEIESTQYILDYSNVVFPMTFIALSFLSLERFNEVENRLNRIENFRKNKDIPEDMTLIISFIKNYCDYKTKLDTAYKVKAKDIYFEFDKKFSDSLYKIWLEELLSKI